MPKDSHMSKVNDVSVDTPAAAQKPEQKGVITRTQVTEYLLDVLIVLFMGFLLFCGILPQISAWNSDTAKYQCYAVAFWQGLHAVDALQPNACLILGPGSSTALVQNMQALGLPAGWVKSQSPTLPLHALPHEYPLLALGPFTLGLLVPAHWYQVAFALWMAMVAGIIYFVLKRSRSMGTALAFAAYLVIGSWATAEGRFDLVPSALVLVAVILAGRTRWKWAFALLALATLSKFYPLVLVVPFFIAQQSQSSEKWYAWRRWSALATFAAICIVVMAVSLLLSVDGTLAPLSYFGTRPIQAESLPSALLWLASFLGYPLHYVYSFGSLNVISPLSNKMGLLSTVSVVAGLLYTFWLQWRGKLDIFTACLLTLLITIIAGKVFSPQYLIWLAPLVAYVGKSNWKWLLSWGTVAFLTTWIYPYIYGNRRLVTVPLIPAFYPVVFVRDVIMLGVVVALLYQASRRSLVKATDDRRQN